MVPALLGLVLLALSLLFMRTFRKWFERRASRVLPPFDQGQLNALREEHWQAVFKFAARR